MLTARENILLQIIRDYSKHNDWKCGIDKCYCGLNDRLSQALLLEFGEVDHVKNHGEPELLL